MEGQLARPGVQHGGEAETRAEAFAVVAELEPGLRLAKLNTENEQAIAARFNIRSIPTMVLFSGGREIARQSGAMDAASLTRWVRGELSRSGAGA